MKCRKLLACVFACVLLACGNDTGSSERDYGALLDTLTTQVILPEHRGFVTASDSLVDALQALQGDPSADSLASAQAAWRAARKSYRLLDALHIGPGFSLHVSDRIDVAPADGAGIDALLAGSGSLNDAAVGNAGGAKKGFLGLEYLLFPDAGSAERAPVLLEDDLALRRRELSLSMAHEIAASARQLDDAWEPGKGAYAEQVSLAGRGGAVFPTQRAAVDVLVGGVGYALESMVGVRLAEPLGRKSGGTPRPDLDSTARSDNAVADLQDTLAGVIALYQDAGFSAVVRAKSERLDQIVRDELTEAQAKLTEIPAPFAAAVVRDTAAVQAAYDSSKALKTTWNTDVSSALGATLKPSENDGD